MKRGLHLLRPDRMVESVVEIDPAELVARGIEGLLLDLDNTLVRWQKEEMTEEVVAWLASVQAAGIRLCILSNSFLSKRSERIAARLECAFVRQAQKPRRTGFRKAISVLGTTPASTAIVGDQLFTDILGGNRTGVYTILVSPIHHHESPHTRYVARPSERVVLRYFKRRGHL